MLFWRAYFCLPLFSITALIFFFQFKMGEKAAETISDVNRAFDPGMRSKHTIHVSSRNFLMKISFKDEQAVDKILSLTLRN